MPTYERGLTWEQLETLAYMWSRWEEWGLTWEEFENLTFLEKNENKIFAVEPGEFLLQLHTRDVRDFESDNFTLEYDPDILQVNNFLQQLQYGLPTSYVPLTEILQIVSSDAGKLVFKCHKRAEGLCSGLITLFNFKALKVGDARVRLY